MGHGMRGPRLGAVGALDPGPEEGAAQRRVGLRAERLHLQLQLGLQLGLLLGLLVALLQVFHQHGNHHVDQHKLGRQHEGHEVDGGDDCVVAGGLLVAVPEGVLGEAGRGVRLGGQRRELSWEIGSPVSQSMKEETEGQEEGPTVWGGGEGWGRGEESIRHRPGKPESEHDWEVRCPSMGAGRARAFSHTSPRNLGSRCRAVF